ncbi:MAG: serine/threonine protein kinase [Pirellulales bacterium]
MAQSPQGSASLRLTSIRKLRSAFGSRGRLSLSRGWLRRHVWLAPVVALVALALAGTWLRNHVERAIQSQVEGGLQALLDADVTALKLWLQSQQANATTAAHDPDVRQPVLSLIKLAETERASTIELANSPERKQLLEALAPWMDAHGYEGIIVIDRQGRVLSAKNESLIGMDALVGFREYVERVFAGQATVSRPFPAVNMLPDEWGGMSVGVPTMFTLAPLRDDSGQIVAVVGFRIRPDREFTRILNVARFGKSGETYAFDKKGVLLSASRFEDQLRQIGLMADQRQARSVLSIELRDPGVDMSRGERPAVLRAQQPLTRMAQEATAGRAGIDVAGYRDYRGVPVVGAWTWLKEYNFGLATEIDQAEIYRPVRIVRNVFWALFGLLAVAALTLLAFTLLAGRLEKRVREAVLAAGKLGQYKLETKIGEGGMGAVYRASHALLRRPTAVKLLEPSRTTDVAIARFEREVQLTSQLNHPNTITIYDYGRTDEGVFYYAMEFLDGYSLQSVVEGFGPQPDGRVIQILLQVCGSLLEAHTMGLIHRDIKPANIMLTRRGGVNDFVKLLDFGLVKATDNRLQTQLTAVNSITGTPLYLPPECIQDPDSADARSDLYSLGGVGYFLLTGRPPFEAATVLEIIRRQVEETPKLPSDVVSQPMAPALVSALMACLEKSPDKRPQSAAQLADILVDIAPSQPWTIGDSRRWWHEHRPVGGATSLNNAATQEFEMGATIGVTTLPRPS